MTAAIVKSALKRISAGETLSEAEMEEALGLMTAGEATPAQMGAFLMGSLTDLIGPRLVAIVPAVGMTAVILWVVRGTTIWNIKVTAPKG